MANNWGVLTLASALGEPHRSLKPDGNMCPQGPVDSYILGEGKSAKDVFSLQSQYRHKVIHGLHLTLTDFISASCCLLSDNCVAGLVLCMPHGKQHGRASGLFNPTAMN